ncbi:MAG: carboxyl transferase domain-containing protein [Pirellulales bacterium]
MVGAGCARLRAAGRAVHSRRPQPHGRPCTRSYDIVSANRASEYEVRDVLECIVDAGTFDEYKAEYGQTLVCGTARIGGFPVGIVANQHHRVKPADGPIQFGGVIYVDSAEKAARFVMNCNQDWLPLMFLQDVNGFMVGRDSEHAGIIKAGAKLVNAISNSRVPKLTVLIGGSLRRRQLRDLRQGVRPAVDLRLADRHVRRDGWRPSRRVRYST